MILSSLFKEFFNSEKASGLILIFVTVISLLLANIFGESYSGIWNYEAGGHSLVHWINEGLMAIFFLLIGLELEREIYEGELSSLRNISFPLFAALGGMIVPALIYLAFNYGTDTQSGFAIPMATDIAFAIGIISLLGNRVPSSLKVFITAFAVIDDLGAILIIALFYTGSISSANLFISLGIFALLILLNRLKVKSLIPFIIGGILMWYFMSKSGVHATISGVLLAFAIPFRGGESSPSYILQHQLHKPVAYFILPLFALANTGIIINSGWQQNILHPSSLGILTGLFIGKPLGILIFTFMAVWLGLSSLPADLKWKNIVGAGFLGGIGFTMSIFITLLAFDSTQFTDNSKLVIIVASMLSGITGYTFLKLTLKNEFSGEE